MRNSGDTWRFVTHEHAGERQRDVERVLAVVIDRVDTEIPRKAAREHFVEMLERAGQLAEWSIRPRRTHQRVDSRMNRTR
ncbi:MAG: hypothetical protein WDO56_22580 [Gammaproteobacteria bacterium]